MSRFLETFFENHATENASLGRLPTLDDLVGEYIRAILVMTHHNITQTARILNISRTTLYSRIRRYSS
jgi:transcriptional regulator of acetoin/glycerol metabolism